MFCFTKPVGGNNGMARALAIDAGDAASPYGNVWVGLYQSRQFYGYQGTDGELLERDGLENPIAVGHSPYGAVVDSNGYVWSGTLSRGTIVGFDSRTGRASGVFSPTRPPASSYGFSIDGENRLWVGARQRHEPLQPLPGQPRKPDSGSLGGWRRMAEYTVYCSALLHAGHGSGRTRKDLGGQQLRQCLSLAGQYHASHRQLPHWGLVGQRRWSGLQWICLGGER